MRRFDCERRSSYAGWLTADGEFVPARCGAPNRCPYCAYMTTVENAVVVGLDAQAELPTLGLTLTTVDPAHGAARFREDVSQTFKWLRSRLGDDLGYLGLVEYTTGKRARDGERRLHQHMLLKRGDLVAAVALEDELRAFWCRRTGADRVELRALRSPAGATAYLVHHHRKREQVPPAGWTGKRMRPSKNYYHRPVAELRTEARAMARSASLRRAARRLIDWEVCADWPEEVLQLEFADALRQAREDAGRVEFVRLDRKGAIIPASRRRVTVAPG